LKVASPEEIAYRLGYINAQQLQQLAAKLGKSSYADYLRRVVDEKVY
jgi:glucose-1-phosphate thymidylyltransferase